MFNRQRHQSSVPLLPFLTAVLLAVAHPTAAQTPPSTSASGKAEPTPVQLSPFEVNTDKDTGFAAASSLAGGRLASDLRDTPVAYSVITRDFIDALNLTDLQSAAEWTTSSTASVDNGQQNFFFNPIQYTVRGASGGRPQRNFFPQFNNGDSYNLERYDFGRGPTYSSTAQSAHVMRPLNNDYTSPARETVPRYYALKQPISYTLTLTTKL